MKKASGNIQKEFIDRQIEEFADVGEAGEILNRHNKMVEFVLKHSKKDDHILDIGCFDGKMLKALEARGYINLYAIDFSQVASKSFTGTKIHFAACDIEHESIPFKQKFDVVIMSDVLEHLFSPQTTLFDIKKSLVPDARVIYSVPNAGWFMNGFLLTFLPSKLFLSTAFGPWGHAHQFTFYEARKMAQSLGFNVLELSGGKMDNYVFKSGMKKVLFDLFIRVSNPLSQLFPQAFFCSYFWSESKY